MCVRRGLTPCAYAYAGDRLQSVATPSQLIRTHSSALASVARNSMDKPGLISIRVCAPPIGLMAWGRD
jgi:hypothetical protein